jgi:gamma-glutamyltranspeptidase/glutathione hydrolase
MPIALPRPLVRATRGVVACGHPLAAGCGRDQLARGGSAVDAAVSAAYALAVLLPDACGLGGDAFALVRTPDGTVRAYNGSGAAPSLLRGSIPVDGGGTVAVPGFVGALAELHADHGTLPMEELVSSAVHLAREGFPVGAELLEALDRHRSRLGRTAAGWPPLAARRPGELVRLPRLAETIEGLAAGGAEQFYRGGLATAIADAAARDGGFLAEADLAGHATDVREPVRGSFHGAIVWLQPPVSQALLGLLVLRGLEPLGGMPKPARVRAGVRLTRLAFQHRDEIALPDAAQRLLALELEPQEAQTGGARAGSHTTAVTAADASGCVVSLLVSVFDVFGSAVLVPEAEFLLNDRLRGFSPDPGSPNTARAGARPVHTLSPALVDLGRTSFALATPGADGQVQFVAQILAAAIGEQTSIAEALAEPRWRVVGNEVQLERGLPEAAAEELARGGESVAWKSAGAGAFGAACVAGVDSAEGTVFAAADPRREAAATGV